MAVDLHGLEEKDVVGAVVDFYNGARKDRLDKERRWGLCEKAFMCEWDTEISKISEYDSQNYVPSLFEAMMNTRAQIAKAMFPHDHHVLAVACEEAASRHAEARTLFMANRLRDSQFRQRYIEHHLPRALIIGNAPIMLEWEKRRKNRGKKRKIKTESGNFEYKPRDWRYSGPAFRSLDIFNWVIESGELDQERARKAYEVYVSKSWLRGLGKEDDDGESICDAAAVRACLDEDPAKRPVENSRIGRASQFGIQMEEGESHQVKIHIAHGVWDLGDGFEDWLIWIGNDKHVLRFEVNPCEAGIAPMYLTKLIDIPGMTYAAGLAEFALGLQETINIRTAQVSDAMGLVVNPMWKAKRDGVLDLDDIVSGPGNVFEMEDTKNLEVLETPLQAMAALGEINTYKAELVDATFSHRNFGAQSRQATATEVATSAALQASVVALLVNDLEVDDIEGVICPFFDEIEKQHWSDSEEPRVATYEVDGKPAYKKITPEVLFQQYDWKAIGSGYTMLRELRTQQTIQILGMSAQTPAVMGTDYEYSARKLLMDLGHRDTDKMVPGEVAMAVRKAIAQMVAPQLGAAGAGGPAGANQPPGMAPLGRGAIPNAGGGANALQSLLGGLGGGNGVQPGPVLR